MQKPFTFQAYDFTLTAGGSQAILAGGEYFRILSATGALDVTVEGKGTMPDLLAGQAIKGLPFQRLVLRDKSGAPNTGFILVASSEFVDNRMFGTFDLSAATLAALESVDLNTATLNTLTRPISPSAVWSDNTASLGAVLTVFAPAANTNGAILLSAYAQDQSTTSGTGAFVAKTSSPSNPVDGEVMTPLMQIAGLSTTLYYGARLDQPAFIAAGKGLYYVQNFTGAAAGFVARSARYRLL